MSQLLRARRVLTEEGWRDDHQLRIENGVIAAIERIVVGLMATRTHGKTGHGGGGAIVRQTANNGVTRTAVRAVGKRIAMVAIGRIGDIGQTGGAGTLIGRDTGAGRAALVALVDSKALLVCAGGKRRHHAAVNPAERGRFALQRLDKGVKWPFGALHLNGDSLGIVTHPTG